MASVTSLTEKADDSDDSMLHAVGVFLFALLRLY
jgi:hypothetical protein